MNVLSSYLQDSRTSLPLFAHDTSKTAISKCGFLCSLLYVLPSVCIYQYNTCIQVDTLSTRVLVANKPPLVSLSDICGQWSGIEMSAGRRVMPSTHEIKRDDAIEARGSYQTWYRSVAARWLSASAHLIAKCQ